MNGDADVIALLNEVLTGELTAINQYFVHAKMQQNWGYARLADYTREESIDEMRHAEWLVDRVLFLDGVPNLQRLFTLTVGETVPEQFRLDLQLEVTARERLQRGIVLCESKQDFVSRELLQKILSSEEQHIDWLETQLSLIESLGEPHYLALQVGDAASS